MRAQKLAAVLILLSARLAAAAEIEVVARGVRFPEGPLWADGALYFVEYGGHTILRLENGALRRIWERQGCGPSSLIRVDAGFLVTCYDENKLVLVSTAGQTVRVYDADADGRPFVGPNDFTADRNGGVYVSASGPWETAPIVGKILYRAADGSLRTVADDLHYPNGLALSPDGATLYASETYNYRIVAFTVAPDGSLSERREFARLGAIVGDAGDRLLAPDGLKTDQRGNLYIALYEGGQVLVSDPSGKLLATIDPPAPKISNVAFGADTRELYITGVLDGERAPWPGEVYRVPNPVAP